jgi:tetratricopeptide (TPR) repeat protein
MSLGQLYMMQERWDDCGQYLDAAMKVYIEAGARAEADLSQVYGLQATLCLARDQIDDARQWTERAGSLLRKMSGTEDGDSVEWGRYEQLMGRIALADNDLEAARRHLKRSAAIFQGRGAQLETGRAAYWSGLLWLAQRQKKRAREELGRAKKTFARLGAAADLQRVEQQLAGT